MSEKKKFGFVVLHYCTLDMTKKCIAAIQEKMAQADYEIVVVDNASGNGTGKDLACLLYTSLCDVGIFNRNVPWQDRGENCSP